MYKPILTEPAESDIAEIVRYIAKELQNPTAAAGLLDDIEGAVASLENNPKRCALVKDDYLSGIGFRFMPVKNYLIFYIVRENKNIVTIERVLYSRRDWLHIMSAI